MIDRLKNGDIDLVLRYLLHTIITVGNLLMSKTMCIFRFDPSQWNRPTKRKEPISCPYNPVVTLDPPINHNFCIFHLPVQKRMQLFPTPQSRIAEYLRAIASKGVAIIFCTTINSINLSTAVKAIAKEIDIQIISSHILGELRLSNEEIPSRITIDYSMIGRFNANESILKGGLRAKNSKFDKFDANETTFGRQCSFESVEFGETDVMSSTFESSVRFQELDLDDVAIRDAYTGLTEGICIFEQTPLFMGTTFKQGVIFAGTVFEQAALFDHSNFVQGGTFYDIDVSIGISFNNSVFGGNTAFEESKLGIAIFLSCEFDKSVIFENATFGNNFTKALTAWGQDDDSNYTIDEIHGLAKKHRKARENEFVEHFMFKLQEYENMLPAATFDGLIVNGLVNMLDVTLKGHISSHRTKFSRVDIRLQSPLKTAAILCDYSSIEQGEIHITDPSCFVQLVNATIGNVAIDSENRMSPFDNIYIDSTNFNGFEFSDYKEELNDISWKIDGAFVEENHVPPTKREATYSKAKAGADLLGDRLAQSEFSILEKRYRREKYVESMKDTDNLWALAVNGFKFITNFSYEGLSKYGQSPKRVFGWSFLLTGVFSVGYNAFVDWSTRESAFVAIPFTDYRYAIDSLALSAQSFTSFIVGPPLTNPSTELVALSSLESFLGAFLIAFFVATVVMKIDE